MIKSAIHRANLQIKDCYQRFHKSVNGGGQGRRSLLLLCCWNFGHWLLSLFGSRVSHYGRQIWHLAKIIRLDQRWTIHDRTLTDALHGRIFRIRLK